LPAAAILTVSRLPYRRARRSPHKRRLMVCSMDTILYTGTTGTAAPHTHRHRYCRTLDIACCRVAAARLRRATACAACIPCASPCHLYAAAAPPCGLHWVYAPYGLPLGYNISGYARALLACTVTCAPLGYHTPCLHTLAPFMYAALPSINSAVGFCPCLPWFLPATTSPGLSTFTLRYVLISACNLFLGTFSPASCHYLDACLWDAQILHLMLPACRSCLLPAFRLIL